MKSCPDGLSRVTIGQGWWRGMVAVIGILLILAMAAGCGQNASPAPAPAASQASPPASSKASASPQASAPPAASNTPDAKARMAALYEAAKKEGTLVYYGSMNAADTKPLFDAFTKQYPGIKIDQYRATNEEVREKSITEFKAGRNEADVYVVGNEDHYYLQREGLLKKQNWISKSSYPKDRIDPEGYWIGTRYNLMVPAYNTNLVSAADAPKTWDDLLDPKWKGKLGLEEEDVPWFAGMLKDRGEEKGNEFMRKLAEQKPQLRKGHTVLTQMLAAGEFAVTIDSYAYHVDAQKAKGAPVEWVRQINPGYSAGVLGVGIAVKAPHPNAAELWAEWESSNDGQAVYASIGRPPAKPDLPNPDPKIKDMMVLKTYFLPAAWAQDEEKYRKAFEGYFWQNRN